MPVPPDDPRIARCGFAKLVVTDGAGATADHFLTKPCVSLGRRAAKGATADVLLDGDATVSRRHCLIRHVAGRSWELVVVGKNSARVNGGDVLPARASEPDGGAGDPGADPGADPPPGAGAPLQSRDVIELGGVRLTFLLPAAGCAAAVAGDGGGVAVVTVA